ncbi:MAG: DUF2278 family protein [Bacillota bacterium]
MANSTYGVLIGQIDDIKADPADEKTPHYEIKVRTSDKDIYNVNINCQSRNEKFPRILYYIDNDCSLDLTNNLKNMNSGFHQIDYHKNINSNIAVDYIKQGLVKRNKMTKVPYDIEGENDLKGFLDMSLKKAIDNMEITIFVYGTYYSSDSCKGIHNIHMNQGNRDKYYKENDIYHDGCLFLHLTNTDKWTAYYLAFQNQSWNTDEKGNPQD